MLLRAIKRNILLNAKILAPTANNVFAFSSSIPYKFGGIPQQQTFLNNKITMLHLFGPYIFDELSNAYLATLQALANQDKDTLAKILQRNLIPQTKISQYDSQTAIRLIGDKKIQKINLQVGKISCIIGGSFDRSALQCKKILGRDFITLYFGNISNKDVKILFCFNIFFNSNNKLLKVPKNSKQFNQIQKIKANQLQTHSVQFQIEAELDKTKIAPYISSVIVAIFQAKFGNYNGFNKSYKIFSQMIQKNYQWRIGDIDGILKGNLTMKP